MAIHPQYAEAIMAGRKQVELRKRPLASDVSLVVVYATAPVKRIVGEFSVEGHTIGHPSQVWARLHPVAEVERFAYDAYYATADRAVAIMVGSVRRYRRPVGLGELSPAPPVPQSFAYIRSDVLDQVRSWQPADGSRLGRILATGSATSRALLSDLMRVLAATVERAKVTSVDIVPATDERA